MSGVLFLFPGQGSQWAGMTAWLAAYEAAARVLAAAAAAVPFDLLSVCENGPLELLTRTDMAQPSIFATSLATWAALADLSGWSMARDQFPSSADVPSSSEPALTSIFMGHSLGDYGALVASGILRMDQALQVVVKRGRAMREVGKAGRGGMMAVLGGSDAMVEELCRGIEGIWPANYNSPGQVVVSGLEDALARFQAAVLAAGARKVVRLAVSGAFHSPLMAEASTAVSEALADVEVSSPAGNVQFFSTTEMAFVRPGEVPRVMARQVMAPVKFAQSVSALREQVELVVEVGPGRVLSGLVKKIVPGLTVVSTDGEEALLTAAKALGEVKARGGRQ